ncbi:MAG: Na/Pi symporter [Firmicutes bacterium]|nr:Na/Pi symporter [Bacillota bacterium]
MVVLDILQSMLLMSFGIAVFLFAITHFSRILQQNFKQKLQPIFNKIGSNRFAAVGVGAGATAIMQSSTATTVITVGLVNVGIITLFQATALIMGANIGTTVTSLLIALSHLQVKYLFMSLFFIGLFLRVITSDNNPKHSKKLFIGNLFIGFGAIFIGLEILSSSFSNSDILQNVFYNLFSTVTFPLILILLGAVFTAIIQSSAASVALYMTMLTSGVLTLPSAIFLVLGSEIGTCSTTLIASTKANTVAKKAAAMHLIFNLFSAILFAIILWPFGRYILPVFVTIIPNSALQISIFQIIYNVISVAVLLPFIRPLNKLVDLKFSNKHS